MTTQHKQSNGISWGDVVQASNEKSDVSLTNEEIKSGDIAHHPQFGSCNVLTVDDEYIKMAPENGKLYKLKRIMIEITFLKSKDNTNEFQLEMKRQK